MSGGEEANALTVVATVARFAGRPLSTLSANDIEVLAVAGLDLTHYVIGERVRRSSVSRSAGHLKLAAQDGELTAAGRAIVQVQAHNAAKARPRKSVAR